VDHRDRVVDLVSDAGGELADGGELLAAHELLLGGFERGGALGDLVVQLVAPALQGAGLVVDGVEQVVQRRRQPADLVGWGDRADAGGSLATFHAAHRLGHSLQRSEDAPRRPQRPPRRQQHHREEHQPDARQHGVFHRHERPLQKPDVEHPAPAARPRPPAAGSPRHTSP